MDRLQAKRMTPRASVAAAASVLVLIAAGCGGNDFANAPRPPAPITVSAAISPHRVSVSPPGFGAGAVNLLVTNQTGASQRVTLRSLALASGKPLEQTTGPINPNDTALLKADLGEGTYTLSVSAPAIDAAKFAVGHRRASASNTLLMP